MNDLLKIVAAAVVTALLLPASLVAEGSCIAVASAGDTKQSRISDVASHAPYKVVKK